ncbi:hypothetical protein [Longimicrobium sp.]|uniref:hypothetical protein n=1 Tax=Longimicrobium sp. TaxID=2029185 RepID=UPI003B3B4DDA
MKYVAKARGLVLTTAAVFALVVTAAGCGRTEPLLPHSDPAAQLDGGVLVGSGHADEEPETTTTNTVGPDTVERGPGTIGSGH